MPSNFSLPDDSQATLSAQVKDEAGYVDSGAVLAWATSDPNVLSLSSPSGSTVTVAAEGPPGSTAEISVAVQDSTGQAVTGPDGNALGDTLAVTISPSDLAVGIVPGDVTEKPADVPTPTPAPEPAPPAPPDSPTPPPEPAPADVTPPDEPIGPTTP